MRLAPRNLQVCIVFLMLFVLGIGTSPAAEKGYYKGLYANHPLWLQFGPAVLNLCRRIEWFRGHAPLMENGKELTFTRKNREGKEEIWVESDLSKPNKTTIAEGDPRFATVFAWIRATIGNKLNCVPEKPDWKSNEASDGALILYASPTEKPKGEKWPFIPHMLTELLQGEEMYKDVLLVIPLSSETLGGDEEIHKFKVSELDALFSGRPLPKKCVDPEVKELEGEKLEYNKSYGFMDKTGRMVFNAGDADVLDWKFSDGLLRVQKNGKVEFWNKQGKPAFAGTFEDALRFSEGLCAVRANGKWGYIDINGKTVIQPTFENARYFSEGLAPACMQGKWGYIDKSGKFMVPPRFAYCIGFSEGLAAVSEHGNIGFINKKGDIVIKPAYDQASSFFDGVAGVTVIEGPKQRHDVKWVDHTGKIVFDHDRLITRLGGIPQISYGQIKPFSLHEIVAGQTPPVGAFYDEQYQDGPSYMDFTEGLLCLCLGEVKGRSLHAYVDNRGSLKFKIESPCYPGDFSEGLASIALPAPGKMHGKYGFVNKRNTFVISPRFDLVESFHDGVAVVHPDLEKSEMQFIDKAGKVLASRKNDSVTPYSEGLARIGHAFGPMINEKIKELRGN